MLDYELITAEDATQRAEGWKKLGITHIEKGEWDEAGKCFKKAATFFGEAGHKENRKLMNSMVSGFVRPRESAHIRNFELETKDNWAWERKLV